MQQAFSAFEIGPFAHQPCAYSSEPLEPLLIFPAEFGFEFLADALRQRRAESGGRDRNLQRAPPHDGGKVEVAAWRLVDCVAQDAAAIGLAEDQLVHFVI